MKYRFDQIAVNITTKKKPTEQDRFNYIGLEHLDSGSLTVSRWGSDVAPKGEKLLMHKGDVLFGKRRAYQKKVAIAPFDGIFSAHGMVLRPNEEVIDKNFFPMFISSDYFLDAAIALSVGSLSPTINWRDLARQEFELPPIEKQRELANVLWSIEDTRTAYQELATATEELVKSRFVEMFGTPNEMDKWPCCNVEDIADVTVGLVIKPTRFYTEDTKNGVKAFRSLNVREMRVNDSDWVYFSKEGNEQNKKSQVQKGDVLVVRSGYPGTSCVVTDKYAGCNAIDIMIAHPRQDKINPYYLCAFNNFPHGMNQIRHGTGGAAQKHFNVGAYNKVIIPVPPIELQNRFVEFLHLADKSKLVLRQLIEKQELLRSTLMQEYLG